MKRLIPFFLAALLLIPSIFAGAQVNNPISVASFLATKGGTDQTGVASGTWTAVTYSTVTQTGGFFASNAWTPPAGKIHFDSQFDSSGTITAASICGIAIVKDGTRFRTSLIGSTTNECDATISLTDVATGANVYSIQVFIVTGAGTATITGSTTTTGFQGYWISP